MLTACPDELTCDFAETYGVFDCKSLPVDTAAVLAWGLRDGSRVKLKLSSQAVSLETLLLAIIADRVGLQLWSGTKDAQHNRNRPESIVDRLTQGQDKDELKTFRTAADFEAAFYNLAGGE